MEVYVKNKYLWIYWLIHTFNHPFGHEGQEGDDLSECHYGKV